MTKQNNPTGVRFNKEKLAFVMERENLDSPQKVVNFFLDSYWWQNKLQGATKYPIGINTPSSSETLSPEPKIDLCEVYKTEIIATTYSGDLQKVMKEIEANGELGAANKAKLRIVANDHRTNFTN